MRLLLDTHALLWWLAGDEALSTPARAAIADEGADVFVSAASVWEIATKHRIGKLPGVAAIVGELPAVIAEESFIALPIDMRHARIGGSLPGPHLDPFDRMLIAQAIVEDLAMVSNKQAFDDYGVRRIW